MTTPSASEGQSPVRWGILGTANIARAKVVPGMVASPWCEVRAVGSRDGAKAEAFAREFGIPAAYDSYEAVLDDPEVEAVYIPLPNHMHVDFALAAAQKGKHVLCEKPIGLNAGEARQLEAVPDGVVVAEAFMVRNHPQWERLRQDLRSGNHGRALAAQVLLSFNLTNRGDFRYTPDYGGGVLYDLGCYAVMTTRYVFEAEPRRVFAAVERDADTGVDTLVSAVLDYGEGRLGSFTVGIRMAAAQRLQIVCERSSLDLPAPYVPSATCKPELVVDAHDALDDIARTSEPMPDVAQYECEVTNFARTVRGDRPHEFGVADAVGQMAVIDALFASEKTGAWQPV